MRDRTSELRLAEVLMEATNTLADDFDPERHLSRVAGHCVELLDASATGVMFKGPGTSPVAVGGHPPDLALDLLAAQQSGGPCVESLGTGRTVPPVLLTEPEPAGRWPEFTEVARTHGIAVTYAVPLRRHDDLLGALNVFVPGTSQGPYAEGELLLAQAIADAIAVGLHNFHTYSEYRTLTTQLQGALTSRIRIEQAKGILAERRHTSVDEAFDVLRRYARRERLLIDLVATEVIKGSIDDKTLRGS
ncbi:ANTAR domain-containing protein [Streptomyces sp. NPDC048441]|uniref:ANTAR domain-containing protein n=1 Tax=Streptomyces sp. NPDC048441 TaxID=3365552 RepID=UPI0037132F89